MKNYGRWLWLLNKRLYKKITFLLILLLIPVLVIGYGFTSQEDSGVLTITLAQDGNDPMATQIIEELVNEPSLIRFIYCDSVEEAKKMISDGKADAAWLFPENMEQKVYRFINSPNKFNAFLRIVERDNSVPLKLTREKLSGTVFSHTSQLFYLNYIRENVPELDHLTDEELMQHYNDFTMDLDLFQIVNLDGDDISEDSAASNYLLAPVRGLLGVVITLGALAAAMYYIQDQQAGTFSLVPQNRQAPVEFLCQCIAVGNLVLVALVALFCANLNVSIVRELLVTILYIPAVALFAMNIRRWCAKAAAIGSVLPLLIVVMLVVCPIFFDFGTLRTLQYFFPPTYYVSAAYSDYFLSLFVLYDLCLFGVYYLSGKLLKRA